MNPNHPRWAEVFDRALSASVRDLGDQGLVVLVRKAGFEDWKAKDTMCER